MQNGEASAEELRQELIDGGVLAEDFVDAGNAVTVASLGGGTETTIPTNTSASDGVNFGTPDTTLGNDTNKADTSTNGNTTATLDEDENPDPTEPTEPTEDPTPTPIETALDKTGDPRNSAAVIPFAVLAVAVLAIVLIGKVKR